MGTVIEQNLLIASEQGDIDLFKRLLSNLSGREIQAVKILPDILSNLARLEDSALSENMTRLLISKGGGFLDPVMIGRAMAQFIEHDNLGALDIVIDPIASGHKSSTQLSAVTGTALMALADSTAEQEAVTAAAKNLVYKLGDQVDASIMGRVMLEFAQNHDYKTLEVITDHLTSSQKQALSLSEYSENIFSTIVANSFFSEGDPDAGSTLRELMSKLNWKSAEENVIRDVARAAAENEATTMAELIGEHDSDTIVLSDYDPRGELGQMGIISTSIGEGAGIEIAGILEQVASLDQAIADFISSASVNSASHSSIDAGINFINVAQMDSFLSQPIDALV